MHWNILLVCIFMVHAEPEFTPTTTELAQEATTPTISVREIDGLRTIGHGVSSDKILVIGNNTFEIPNFRFDGAAPQAFFIVGKGEVSGNATFLYLDDSHSPLPQYDGKPVTLTLPEGLTVKDIDWLAVWCVKYQQNLGDVFVNEGSENYPPQTYNLNNIVTSAAVVLVNKKTLFIPSFRYNADHSNVHFWVGNGTEPSSEGVLVPDETGSVESLHSYQGQNLYIKLPRGLTTDNIDYFGVWSEDEKISLGSVPIKGVEGVPPEREPRGLVPEMRLPKCCPIGSTLGLGGCEEFSAEFKPNFKVYEHNETHFSNESMNLELIRFIPFVSNPQCQSSKYPLMEDMEEFGLLLNTSLLLKSAAVSGILSPDKFCLENRNTENDSYEMSIFICVPEQEIHRTMFRAYIAFTIISTLCFAAAFFFYFFWLKVANVHKQFFTGYVFAMTITFLALTIVQTANVEGSACTVLGFVFQISMIASFTLLAILCVDIFIIIKTINDDVYSKQRKFGFLGVAFGVPLLFLIISLSRNLTPDVPNSFFKPQYLQNNCFFEAEEQRTIIFYVPIGLSIVVSAVFLLFTKLKIVYNDKENEYHWFWMEKGHLYKFMWRKHLIIFVISFLWSLEALIHMFLEQSSMMVAVDIVEASQGILVLLLFVVNRDARNQIVRSIKATRRKANNELTIVEQELMPITTETR